MLCSPRAATVAPVPAATQPRFPRLQVDCAFYSQVLHNVYDSPVDELQVGRYGSTAAAAAAAAAPSRALVAKQPQSNITTTN